MKKALLLLCIATLFVACNKTIDKKIVLTEYQETIKQIEKENPEYSKTDYAKADKLLDTIAFNAASKGTMTTEKTYRQLLDEAKAENKKDSIEIASYNNGVDKLRSIISVTIKQAKFIPSSIDIPVDMISAISEFKNLSKKDITGLEGTVLVKNNANTVIAKLYIKTAGLLSGNDSNTVTDTYPVSEELDDNIIELKADNPKTFKYEWDPELIIFKDGTRAKAPDKPSAMSKD